MHTEQPRPVAVSVIIVNYNSGDKLAQCVTSLFQVSPDIDMVVVDNASTDDSLSKLEDVYSNNRRAKIIRNQNNFGFAVGCNMGTGQAKGQYLLYLNPDCVVDGKTLPALLACLIENPSAGMVGGLLVDPDGTEQAGGRRAIPTPWRALVRVLKLSVLAKRYPRLFADFHLHQQPLPDHPIEVEAISGACMLVRREALKDVGGLDEGYFLHCEDLDWCMRFRQKGWKILFAPNAKVSHHLGACSKVRPVFVEWHKHKGMVRFYRKFFRHQYPGILMWVVVLGVWLRFIVVASYHSLLLAGRWLGSKHVVAVDDASSDGSLEALDTSFFSEVHDKSIGVIGATSFVGECLLPLLVGAEHNVVAFTRRSDVTGQTSRIIWKKLPKRGRGSGSAQHVYSNPSPSSGNRITHWVCLAPIWVLPDHLAMLKAFGAQRVVVLSSTSRITKTTSSNKAEQKLAARIAHAEDEFVSWAEKEQVEWTILQPTLIYGFGKDRNISELARFISRFGFYPLCGAAHGLRQPIYAGDVAEACLLALNSDRAINRTYVISGGETLSYQDMVGRIFKALGMRPRFFRIPLFAFRPVIGVLRRFPRFKDWSVAMVERMNKDMVFEHQAAKQDFGFSPRPFQINKQDLPRS